MGPFPLRGRPWGARPCCSGNGRSGAKLLLYVVDTRHRYVSKPDLKGMCAQNAGFLVLGHISSAWSHNFCGKALNPRPVLPPLPLNPQSSAQIRGLVCLKRSRHRRPNECESRYRTQK